MFGIARLTVGTVSGLLAAVLLSGSASAQSGPAKPLFSADSPLALTLSFPLRRVVARASARPEVEGSVSYDAPSGRAELDVEVTTRGKSRLEICTFPPLRLNFRRSQLTGTVFAGQNRIKLATRCRAGTSYADYLELEYLIYRFYQQISDFSFLVRPVDMRYVDSERGREETAPAFFIEEKDDVAERVGMRVVDVPRIDLGDLEPRSLARLALFQYVIANTDWSAIAPSGDEDDCCHNGAVLAGDDGSYFVVPYDFDQAGLIDTSYATPAEGLRIRTVRERLYRGFCVTNEYLDDAVASLNAARPAIEALLDGSMLTDRKRGDALDFLDESYAIINDPEQRQREVVEKCRGG